MASAIRQGKLISQSEIHRGSADKLNKQPVSHLTGELEPPKAEGQQVQGQEKGKQVSSKEP